MQIIRAVVTPIELKLKLPLRIANLPRVDRVTAVFVRIETRDGHNAWGCGVAHPILTGEEIQNATEVCSQCADIVPDLHPINIEYSLAQLAPLVSNSPAASCAFDLAFHDLLGLAADMPLYRLFGGFRNQIQTSATVPISGVQESVEQAQEKAASGFRMLKIKGGLDPAEDVRRVQAIKNALPGLILRLDADGGYSVQQAINVSRALEGKLEMLEQPTPFENLDDLRQVTQNSQVPVLADQSVTGITSALEFAAKRNVDGIAVKVATCGGLHCSRQVDTIARAGGLATMVGCVIEPALLISAGLSLALSSPNVRYADLDGNLELLEDPTTPGFRLEEGWLIASDVPGLGCTVDIS